MVTRDLRALVEHKDSVDLRDTREIRALLEFKALVEHKDSVDLKALVDPKGLKVIAVFREIRVMLVY
jgi:hypothetical protein